MRRESQNIPVRESHWTFVGPSVKMCPIGTQTLTVEEIGAVVRQARLAQGLRQDQLAAAAGVGLRFLVELERGKPTVRLAKVLSVLDALGCRLHVTTPPATRRGSGT
jgi:y4mF family transcriptional regulator